MHWRASDLVDRLAAEDRTGLIFVDEYGHRRDYTFAEVAKHSLRYAEVLRAFGVREDDRVYVSLSATAKCVFTLLALERAGARAILDEGAAASAAAVISNRKYRARIDAMRDHFSPDARYLLIGEECEGWARLDTLAQVAFTNPQPQQGEEPVEWQQARERVQAQLGAFPTDTVWLALQIEDGDWFDRAIVQPWLCGAAATLHDGTFDARERLDLVRELDVTILLQRVDEYHAELALPDPARFKMPRLRRCVVLGDGYDEELQVQWTQRFGVPLTPYAAASRPPSSDPAPL
jgi:acyl-coenzyme A synthetase/AMP-(fatty) acid ligase